MNKSGLYKHSGIKIDEDRFKEINITTVYSKFFFKVMMESMLILFLRVILKTWK